jgi:hypothetical protein
VTTKKQPLPRIEIRTEEFILECDGAGFNVSDRRDQNHDTTIQTQDDHQSVLQLDRGAYRHDPNTGIIVPWTEIRFPPPFPHLKKKAFHLYVTRQVRGNLLSCARVTGECIYIL